MAELSPPFSFTVGEHGLVTITDPGELRDVVIALRSMVDRPEGTSPAVHALLAAAESRLRASVGAVDG